MTLSHDVNLEELANQCTYFTGADFKALLYNAQLNAIHEQYGFDVSGTSNAKMTSLDGDVTSRRAKNSDSENSVTSTESTSSWEAVNIPQKGSWIWFKNIYALNCPCMRLYKVI